MTNGDKIRSMNDEQLSRLFCAISADPWGYCKAEPDEVEMNINMAWLEKEADRD